MFQLSQVETIFQQSTPTFWQCALWLQYLVLFLTWKQQTFPQSYSHSSFSLCNSHIDCSKVIRWVLIFCHGNNLEKQFSTFFFTWHMISMVFLLWCHFQLPGDLTGFCGFSGSKATVCSNKLSISLPLLAKAVVDTTVHRQRWSLTLKLLPGPNLPFWLNVDFHQELSCCRSELILSSCWGLPLGDLQWPKMPCRL